MNWPNVKSPKVPGWRAMLRRGAMPGAVLVLLTLLASACGQEQDPAKARDYQAQGATGPILIGAAAPWKKLDGELWRGIQLAAAEVNQAGGVIGRQLKIIKKNDKGTTDGGIGVAQEFADNLDVVAIVGHYDPPVSLLASVLYQYYGLVMISTTTTNSGEFGEGFNRIFTTTSNARQYADFAARLCRQKGFKNVVIYQEDTDYGRLQANAFEVVAETQGVNINDRRVFNILSGRRQFLQDLTSWQADFDFDAIFLTGLLPQTGVFINEARKLGVKEPIICTESMDSPALLKIVGTGASGIYVVSVFDPNATVPRVKKFVRRYREKYHQRPDTGAALGYDSLKLLVGAISQAKSSVPGRIALELARLKNWRGVTSVSAFSPQGEAFNGPLVVKEVKDGAWEYFVLEKPKR
jgi:branched-chain amino acid transport system substrate-binding protein